MGNNLLNVCKNTSAPTDQNDGESEQTQKEKQEKRKLERKRTQKKQNDLTTVHAEGIISNKVKIMEEQSDASSQQNNAYDGQSSQSGENTSLINQESENQINKKRKGQQNSYGKKNKLVNNFISNSQQSNEKFQMSQQESMKNEKEQGGTVQEVEEIRQLKNNNDRYLSKDDLDFYEIKYKNEKKVTPPKDKNIRWQQGEVLGTGSFGQVILGMNIDTGEFMAVKQVHIGGYNQQDRKEAIFSLKMFLIHKKKVQQIQSEIEALQNFSDKNIVRYIGIKKSETSINIFLEYVPGGSISSLLYRYGKFNETLIKKFTQQILKGLEYLHAHEIIHRDIKGANVLVDKDGNCKLADFGSAKKIVEEKGHNDSIRGTPYWMAPETIKQAGSGRFADIWSIGCTVIEMATAKPPWADKNPIQAMFYIANAVEPPPIPDGLSQECKDFISKCLRINPNDRYNVRQLLNHIFISGKKQNHMLQSIKQLPQITEEATVDYQTSSPDKRKEFLTRGESRGNTLFHEENSMKDTSTEKTRAFSIKTKTQKSTKSRKSIRLRESDGDNSQDSIDLGKQIGQLNNPRPLNPQAKIIQSRSTQQNYSQNKNHSSNSNNFSGEKFQNSLEKNSIDMTNNNNNNNNNSNGNNINNEQSSESSSSRSSSNSSASKGRKTNTQTYKSNTENIPIRKKQVTPFSLNHKAITSQHQKQPQQPSEYSGTKSIYSSDQDTIKDKSSQNIKDQSFTSEWSSDGNFQITNKLPLDTFKINSISNQQPKIQQAQNNSSNFKNFQQNSPSSNEGSVPPPYKTTNNNVTQSLLVSGYNQDPNSSNGSQQHHKENSDKKQSYLPSLQSYSNNNKDNINNDNNTNLNKIEIKNSQQEQRKVQKVGELKDSSPSLSSQSSSSNSPKSSNKFNSSPNKMSQIKYPNEKQENTETKYNQQQQQNPQKQESPQKQLIYIDCSDEEDEDEDGQFQFDQKAVDSIIQHQGQKPSRDYQIEDQTSQSFNKEKFGKLKFSKPTSPKQLTTQQSGTIFNNNNNSFDQIGYDNKTNNVITENTHKNKGIGSLKQEDVQEYSKYFGQNHRGRNEDYISSSIDQHMISQYINHNQKHQNNAQQIQPNSMGRQIDSINIDDYTESQFESYNSKQSQQSKQNIIGKAN